MKTLKLLAQCGVIYSAPIWLTLVIVAAVAVAGNW
jgi:hypothetical protein